MKDKTERLFELYMKERLEQEELREMHRLEYELRRPLNPAHVKRNGGLKNGS